MRFLWDIFKAAAIPLWLILSLFHAAVLLVLNRVEVRWGGRVASLLLPVLWCGIEYLRSEVWWLRFAWFTAGECWPPGLAPQILQRLGIYGLGFGFAYAAGQGAMLLSATHRDPGSRGHDAGGHNTGDSRHEWNRNSHAPFRQRVALVPVQRAKRTFLQHGLCHQHPRRGGFQQVKSRPIQFFADGEPAPSQRVWDSPRECGVSKTNPRRGRSLSCLGWISESGEPSVSFETSPFPSALCPSCLCQSGLSGPAC